MNQFVVDQKFEDALRVFDDEQLRMILHVFLHPTDGDHETLFQRTLFVYRDAVEKYQAGDAEVTQDYLRAMFECVLSEEKDEENEKLQEVDRYPGNENNDNGGVAIVATEGTLDIDAEILPRDTSSTTTNHGAPMETNKINRRPELEESERVESMEVIAPSVVPGGEILSKLSRAASPDPLSSAALETRIADGKMDAPRETREVLQRQLVAEEARTRAMEMEAQPEFSEPNSVVPLAPNASRAPPSRQLAVHVNPREKQHAPIQQQQQQPNSFDLQNPLAKKNDRSAELASIHEIVREHTHFPSPPLQRQDEPSSDTVGNRAPVIQQQQTSVASAQQSKQLSLAVLPVHQVQKSSPSTPSRPQPVPSLPAPPPSKPSQSTPVNQPLSRQRGGRGRGSSEAQATRGQPSKVTTRSTRSTLRVDDTLGFPVENKTGAQLIPFTESTGIKQFDAIIPTDEYEDYPFSYNDPYYSSLEVVGMFHVAKSSAMKIDASLILMLTKEKLDMIKSNGYILQILCFDTNSKLKPPVHSWPKKPCKLSVNNSDVPIRLKSEKKKLEPQPANITEHCIVGNNTIKLSGKSNYQFVGCLRILAPFTNEQLVARAKQRVKPIAETRKFIRESFAKGGDIIAEKQRVSILDPLVRTQITCPARGLECMHIEFFELQNYIQFNRKFQKWLCPCCAQYVPYEQVIVDGFFLEIIEKLPKEKLVSDIILFPDGRWDYEVDDRVPESDSDDDLDIAPYEGISKEVAPMPKPKPPQEVIDISSDDEDEPVLQIAWQETARDNAPIESAASPKSSGNNCDSGSRASSTTAAIEVESMDVEPNNSMNLAGLSIMDVLGKGQEEVRHERSEKNRSSGESSADQSNELTSTNNNNAPRLSGSGAKKSQKSPSDATLRSQKESNNNNNMTVENRRAQLRAAIEQMPSLQRERTAIIGKMEVVMQRIDLISCGIERRLIPAFNAYEKHLRQRLSIEEHELTIAKLNDLARKKREAEEKRQNLLWLMHDLDRSKAYFEGQMRELRDKFPDWFRADFDSVPSPIQPIVNSQACASDATPVRLAPPPQAPRPNFLSQQQQQLATVQPASQPQDKRSKKTPPGVLQRRFFGEPRETQASKQRDNQLHLQQIADQNGPSLFPPYNQPHHLQLPSPMGQQQQLNHSPQSLALVQQNQQYQSHSFQPQLIDYQQTLVRQQQQQELAQALLHAHEQQQPSQHLSSLSALHISPPYSQSLPSLSSPTQQQRLVPFQSSPQANEPAAVAVADETAVADPEVIAIHPHLNYATTHSQPLTAPHEAHYCPPEAQALHELPDEPVAPLYRTPTRNATARAPRKPMSPALFLGLERRKKRVAKYKPLIAVEELEADDEGHQLVALHEMRGHAVTAANSLGPVPYHRSVRRSTCSTEPAVTDLTMMNNLIDSDSNFPWEDQTLFDDFTNMEEWMTTGHFTTDSASLANQLAHVSRDEAEIAETEVEATDVQSNGTASDIDERVTEPSEQRCDEAKEMSVEHANNERDFLKHSLIDLTDSPPKAPHNETSTALRFTILDSVGVSNALKEMDWQREADDMVLVNTWISVHTHDLVETEPEKDFPGESESSVEFDERDAREIEKSRKEKTHVACSSAAPLLDIVQASDQYLVAFMLLDATEAETRPNSTSIHAALARLRRFWSNVVLTLSQVVDPRFSVTLLSLEQLDRAKCFVNVIEPFEEATFMRALALKRRVANEAGKADRPTACTCPASYWEEGATPPNSATHCTHPPLVSRTFALEQIDELLRQSQHGHKMKRAELERLFAARVPPPYAATFFYSEFEALVQFVKEKNSVDSIRSLNTLFVRKLEEKSKVEAKKRKKKERERKERAEENGRKNRSKVALSDTERIEKNKNNSNKQVEKNSQKQLKKKKKNVLAGSSDDEGDVDFEEPTKKRRRADVFAVSPNNNNEAKRRKNDSDSDGELDRLIDATAGHKRAHRNRQPSEASTESMEEDGGIELPNRSNALELSRTLQDDELMDTEEPKQASNANRDNYITIVDSQTDDDIPAHKETDIARTLRQKIKKRKPKRMPQTSSNLNPIEILDSDDESLISDANNNQDKPAPIAVGGADLRLESLNELKKAKIASTTSKPSEPATHKPAAQQPPKTANLNPSLAASIPTPTPSPSPPTSASSSTSYLTPPTTQNKSGDSNAKNSSSSGNTSLLGQQRPKSPKLAKSSTVEHPLMRSGEKPSLSLSGSGSGGGPRLAPPPIRLNKPRPAHEQSLVLSKSASKIKLPKSTKPVVSPRDKPVATTTESPKISNNNNSGNTTNNSANAKPFVVQTKILNDLFGDGDGVSVATLNPTTPKPVPPQRPAPFVPRGGTIVEQSVARPKFYNKMTSGPATSNNNSTTNTNASHLTPSSPSHSAVSPIRSPLRSPMTAYSPPHSNTPPYSPDRIDIAHSPRTNTNATTPPRTHNSVPK